MHEAYAVGVKLTLVNDFTKGLTMASVGFKALGVETEKLEKRLKSIKNLSMAGGGFIGAGFAITSPIIYAISKAAELQKQIIGIQIATHGTNQEMEKLRFTMESASSRTVFSTVQVADMAKLIATSNSFNASQVNQVLPAYARFADVQKLLKGTDYNTSVLEAVRLAHTAQIYDPVKLTAYLDTLTKATIITPGSITELGTALKYSQGTAQTALGVDPQNMVLLTALLNRMGFAGSRGGTNLIDAMIRTMPGIFGSGLLEGKSNQALRHMGLVDSKGHSLIFTNGKFDAMKWMQGLAAFVQKDFATMPEAQARQDILTTMQHSFGAQGRRVATLLSSQQAIDQLLAIGKQFDMLASTGAIQDKFVTESVSQQFTTSLTNFQNALTELGYTLLPLATKFLNAVNHELGILIPWMQAHQQEVKRFAEAVLLFGGVMLIVGPMLLLVAAFEALLTPLGAVVGLVTALTAALTILAPTGIQKAIDDGSKKIFGAAPHVLSHGVFYSLMAYLRSPSNSETQHSFNPFNTVSNFFGNIFSKPANAQPVQVSTQVNLDGHSLAQVTSKHISKIGSLPPVQGSNVDPNMSLMPPQYQFGGGY
jgi:hypothetical protein